MTEALQQEIRTLKTVLESERDPEGRAFAPLADAYRRAGEIQQAVRLLNEGLARHPDFVPGHVVAAQLYVEQGLAEEAAIAARQALALDGDNVNALRSLLLVLEERGDGEADEVRDRLRDLEPAFTQEGEAATTPPSPAPETATPLDGIADAGAEVEPEAPTVGAAGAPAGAEEIDSEAETVEVRALGPDEPPALQPTAAVEAVSPEDAELGLVEPDPAGVDRAVDEPLLDLDSLGPLDTSVEPEAPDDELTISEAVIESDLALDVEEPVVELDSLAPVSDDVEAEDLLVTSDAGLEPAIGLPTEEPVVELDDLAPAAAEEEPSEQVVSLADLAPDSTEETVELSALAPDEDSEEPVMDLAELAPDAEEPVMELADLAPEAEVHEPVMDLDDLAPEAGAEEETLEISALAPDDGSAVGVDEPVADLADLAPDAEAEEPVMDLADLAPDAEAEQPVMELTDLAPGPEAEEPAVELADLAPDSEDETLEIASLAPDDGSEEEPDESVAELADLAPDDDEREAEEQVVAPTDMAPDAEEGRASESDVTMLDLMAQSPQSDEEPEPESQGLAEEGAAAASGADSAADGVEDSGDGDSEDDPTDSDEESPGEPVYTRTLAELYVKQGAIERAIEVYRQLSERRPEDETLKERLAELEDGEGLEHEAEPVLSARTEEEVETLARELAENGEDFPEALESPYTLHEADDDDAADETETGPTIGDYFDGLLNWQPEKRA